MAPNALFQITSLNNQGEMDAQLISTPDPINAKVIELTLLLLLTSTIAWKSATRIAFDEASGF